LKRSRNTGSNCFLSFLQLFAVAGEMEDGVKNDAPRKSLKIRVWRVARFPEGEETRLAVGVLLTPAGPFSEKLFRGLAMRLTLRLFCATSSLVVALFSAKLASADTIPNPFIEMRNNASTMPQMGSGSMTTYSVLNGSSIYSSNGYLEAEDSFVPLFDGDYDDAVVFRKAAFPESPETRNFVLLGSGLLTAAGFIRRRKVAVHVAG
jgi:hypothetical protein